MAAYPKFPKEGYSITFSRFSAPTILALAEAQMSENCDFTIELLKRRITDMFADRNRLDADLLKEAIIETATAFSPNQRAVSAR